MLDQAERISRETFISYCGCGKAEEVMQDYPIIVGELSIHGGSIHKETTLEVRSPVENEVEGSRTPPARG